MDPRPTPSRGQALRGDDGCTGEACCDKAAHWSNLTRSLVLFFLVSCSAAAQPAVVTGRAVDGDGQRLPLVNVWLDGSMAGSVTDGDGRFAFAATQTGEQTVRATLLGHEDAAARVVLAAGDTVRVTLRLPETLATLGEAVVEASGFSSGDAERATFRPLDILTTPGAAADVFRAVQTLPGVTTVDEGAGLFVRGGDVGETAVLLDGARLQHPYRYESPTGGVFGSIPPFFLKGTAFSAGGFSARYGNALSGVLALETLDEPQRDALNASAGLAGVSLGVDKRLLDGRLGVRFSGNRSSTGLLFGVNGMGGDFVEAPESRDVNLSLSYRYAPAGRVKLFSYGTGTRVGAREPQPSFEGVYRARERNRLHVLSWQDLRAGWLLKANASAGSFTSTRRFGNLDLETADEHLGLRLDAERDLSRRLRLAVGATASRAVARFGGSVPVLGDVLDPEAETTTLRERYAVTRAGGYGLVEAQLARRLFLQAGVRTDGHSVADAATVDPRFALRYLVGKHASLRLATGRYSQFPAPEQFGGESGNAALGPQHATHLIASAEYERDHTLLRAEAYLKDYDRLVVRAPAVGVPGGRYENAGTGWARGVDLFAKYGAFLLTRVDGWASYSFLQTRRTQTRSLGGTVALGDGPAPFEATHHLTVVGKARVWRFLAVGTSLRAASGRPHTPVVDAVPPSADEAPYYLPIEGPVGSERLPAFVRVDLNASWYQPFGDGHSATFFVSVGNVLGRANTLGYDYALDYSTRTPRATSYDRFVFAGVSLSLVR
ncbi:MAG: TonB-dependent receptor [Bacteroidota bacterium]